MTSNQNQLEELFPGAYRNFEFEQLLADLEKALKEVLNKNNFMPASKVALVGRLCGYSPAQIENKADGEYKYPASTLRQALSKEIYPTIKKLLQLEEEIDWTNADLLQLLEKYKKQSQKSLSIDIPGICEQLRDRCSELLQNQKCLSTNSLMARDGVTFEVDDLFINLGLEEHKKPAKLKDISSTELGSNFYAHYDEENKNDEKPKKSFKDREFFEEVIRDHKTLKSHGQRIVIIGEPGAGKTTLLQKISEELQKNKTIPIWISLSRIASKPLSKYLLEDWLRDAAQALETAPVEWKTALEELLKTGQVCLLLDGADEMIVGANERTPLLDIGCQLREGWAKQVRVILTCRLNVWENNALEKFDVYRTLNFDYPTQVEQFIDNFFNRQSVDSQLANDLKAELQLETKVRIRDLVKNPLRLSLLCYAWELGTGSLPDTKAELYELFVQAFYKLHELKDSKLKVPFEKQEELKKALGNLSKEALDSNELRFLLPQSFIERFLGNANDEKSLFWLAIQQLSWLNCVGRIAEKPFENAYAFFHPTFQEYFAALAIHDWHDFLNHVPETPEQGTYRIFEPQWKEVILLWLGRSNQEVLPKHKEEFIKKLLDFDKVCEPFYRHRSYCLAASGIQEFPNYPLPEQRKIVNEIVNWNLNLNDSDFRSTLLETNRQIAIEYLLEKTIQPDRMNYKALKNAFEILSLIGKSNTYAIETITVLMNVLEEGLMEIVFIFIEHNNNFQEYNTIYAIEKNQQFIDALTYIEFTLIKYADSLGKIAKFFSPAHKKAIFTLLQIIFFNNSEFKSQNALKSLIIIGTGSYEEIEVLEHLINTTKNELTRIEAIDCLGKLNPNHPLVIPELLKFIETIENELIREEPGIIQLNEDRKYYILEKALKRLEEMAHSNLEVIPKLINFVRSNNNELSRRDVIECFNNIGKENSKIINCLQNILSSTTDENTVIITAKVLGTINKGNSLAIDKLVNLIEFTKDEQICISAINSLGEIGTGNVKAVNALNEAIKTKNGFTLVQATYNLWKIAPENSEIIPKLEEIISNNKTTDHIRWVAADKLGEINRGNRKAVDTLLQLMLKLTNLKNKNRCIKAAFSLTKVLQNEQLGEMVTRLRDYFLDDNSENFVNRSMACYKVLSHCSQKMKYQDFYHAWHEPTTTHPEAPDNIPVGKSYITQLLNFTQLPSNLDSAIANDEDLNKAVKLICIDINNEFSNPDMLAANIYAQMLNQGCPECPQGRPTNMPLLSIYWQVDLDSGKLGFALLFYNSKNDRTLNPSFLSDIATFGGTIAIISDRPCENVMRISPNDPNLVDTVLKWLKREVLEA